MFKKGQRGFTLIELLIVIAILGVLVAVVVPNVVAYTSRANVAAANVEVETVRTAVYAYMADNGGIAPADSSNLTEFLFHQIKGTYTFSTNGTIATATGWNGLTWANDKWNR